MLCAISLFHVERGIKELIIILIDFVASVNELLEFMFEVLAYAVSWSMFRNDSWCIAHHFGHIRANYFWIVYF